MESQFGIANVWTQGDFVTRFVALLLLGMIITGVRTARVANERLLLVLDDVEQAEAER